MYDLPGDEDLSFWNPTSDVPLATEVAAERRGRASG